MADNQNPVKPIDNLEQQIREVRIQAANAGMDPSRVDMAAQVMSSSAGARTQYTQDFFKNVGDLFNKRPEIAKKLIENIVELGNKAGQKRVEVEAMAAQAQIELDKLASASTTELDKKYQETSVSWGGFWLGIGRFLQGIPGLQGAAQWCLDTAERMQPGVLKSHLEGVNKTKENISIDAGKAASTATSVTPKAVAYADPNNPEIGYNANELAKIHGTTDDAREKLGRETPVTVKPLPADLSGPTKVPAAGSASVGNIDAIASDVASKMSQPSKGKDGKDVAPIKDKAALNDAIASSDFAGNNDGNWNDGKAFQTSKAYKDLDEKQKTKINDLLGIDASGNIVRPVAGLKDEPTAKVNTPAPVPQ